MFCFRFAFVEEYTPVQYAKNRDPINNDKQSNKLFKPVPPTYKPSNKASYKKASVQPSYPMTRRGLRDPYDPR